MVRPVEGVGVRQAVSKHNLDPHARHTTSEAGSHAAYAGEHFNFPNTGSKVSAYKFCYVYKCRESYYV